MSIPAFVLCGGLGTRLRDAVADVPKVLAPIAGRPFLELFVGALHRGGIRRVVLLAGYMADQVEAYVRGPLHRAYPDVAVDVSVEPAPLGTGGAIKHASRFIDGTFLVLNGDTYVELDAAALLAAHRRAAAALTIAAVHVDDAGRFGAIDVRGDEVLGFREKGVSGPGLVNAGVYVIEPRVIETIPAGAATSLERDTLPALLAHGAPVRAVTLPGSFVDIGTPESWAAFSREIAARERST